MLIADVVVRRLESISRRIGEEEGLCVEARRLLATFFTNPHLKTDATLAFDEACEAVGVTGMSPRNVSIRMKCETVITTSVRMAGDIVNVSSIDPLSPSASKENDNV